MMSLRAQEPCCHSLLRACSPPRCCVIGYADLWLCYGARIVPRLAQVLLCTSTHGAAEGLRSQQALPPQTCPVLLIVGGASATDHAEHDEYHAPPCAVAPSPCGPARDRVDSALTRLATGG